ncbi:hypothetical protein P7H20_18170 [Paenibacillus larvae]|nr:hypothetical protein [Paenibacillus larvae]MDT2276370.1 hypothetical protein [Paenibacillus larvae]
MDSEMGVHFEIPAAAVLNTALVFFVIILYTSFQGYRLIYCFKLIDLFKADSQGEKVPKGSLVIALLSVIMIGSGYYLASDFAQAAKKLNVRLDSLCFDYFVSYRCRNLAAVPFLYRYFAQDQTQK